jgi:hypothetical protein
MEPSNRKVNWRRRRAVILLELVCLIGLCGLGYLPIASVLAGLTLFLLLAEEAQS